MCGSTRPSSAHELAGFKEETHRALMRAITVAHLAIALAAALALLAVIPKESASSFALAVARSTTTTKGRVPHSSQHYRDEWDTQSLTLQ